MSEVKLDLSEKIEDAAEAVTEKAEDVVDAAKDVAEDAADAVKDAAEDVSDAAEDAADEVMDAAEDLKDAAEEKAEDVADAVEEAAEEAKEKAEDVNMDTQEAEVEVNIIDDRDEEAESLIRWAAARAGVIVAAPLLGTCALIANEVYMIAKIGTVYGVELSQKAVLSFIGSLGATVVGTTLATLLPIPFISLPVGVSVTYGLGKAAQRWIKDGMPDDTKPYKAVFEEGREEGTEIAGELEAAPEKDIPLGDEKKDFTQDLKKSMDGVYPEKAHDVMDKVASQLTETIGILGDQLTSLLKKAGMTDEQIEKAKYTAIGAGEVASETAKEWQQKAKVKSKEFREDAAKKAEEFKGQAKDQMSEMQKKKEEMKHKSSVQSEQAKLRSEKLKAQARVQMEEAKIKASKMREQAREQAQVASEKAKAMKEKMTARTTEYKDAATTAAQKTKTSVKTFAEDFKAKTEERAAQKRAEAEAKVKGETVEPVDETPANGAETKED